jgi:hypothetical protein
MIPMYRGESSKGPGIEGGLLGVVVNCRSRMRGDTLKDPGLPRLQAGGQNRGVTGRIGGGKVGVTRPRPRTMQRE